MNTVAQKKLIVEEENGFKLFITRVIQAPCELVFKAWTDPKQMAQWYGPQECELKGLSADVKVGGAFRVHLVSPKGDHIATGNYIAIVPNKRLQFSWHWDKYEMPESVVTVDLEPVGNKTRLTLTHTGLPDEEDAKEHTHGWTSMVEKFKGLIEQGKIKA